jgi:O-antigen ligase
VSTSDTVKKNTIDRTINQIKPSSEKVYFFSDEHHALANSSIKIFKDNFILGSGPKTFRIKCSENEYIVKNKERVFGCYTHPHNTYLQILAETGIIGFMFILILFLILISNLLNFFVKKYFYNHYILDNFKVGCLLCFLISLFPVVPSGNFFNNYLNIMYYYPLGIYLGYNFLSKKNN